MPCFRNPPCFRCYPVTLTQVANTTTFQTFASFTVPANDVRLGNVCYVQIAFRADSHAASHAAATPTVQWVWGTSPASITIPCTAWAYDGAPGPTPFTRAQQWAFMLQRDGNTSDPADSDGSAKVQDPSGWTPIFQPFFDVAAFPQIGWDDIDFTIEQLVELQIKWDIADPKVRITPQTGAAVSWGA